MIDHIDHIAIKVTQIEPLLSAFEALGMTCTSVAQYDEVGMRIAFLDSDNNTRMELLEVTRPGSPIVNDADGLHHLGVKVKDIEAVYRQMLENEKYRVMGPIRQGAHSRIFFFKVKGQEEILFECVE